MGGSKLAYFEGAQKLTAMSGQHRHQARVSQIILILMAVNFAVIGTVNILVFGNYSFAALIYLCMVGTLALLVYFWKTANLTVTSWLVVLMLTAIILQFIHSVDGQYNSVIWATVLPPVVFFLLGKRLGAWYCALIFAYVLFFFYERSQSPPSAEPDLGSFLNIAEVFVIHLFLFLYYEGSRTAAYEELERVSQTDKLTGLYNRRHLDKLLLQEFSRHQRADSPLSLVLCDIDHFKRVNDEYGHLIGDVIMQEIAAAVTAKIRNTDIFGRWGGEEFLLILPDTSLDGAVSIVNALQNTLAESRFTRDIKISLSFGIASTANDKDVELQLRRADDALYDAKRRGRDCLVVAPDVLGAGAALGGAVTG